MNGMEPNLLILPLPLHLIKYVIKLILKYNFNQVFEWSNS